MIAADHPAFDGHFPGQPILPGVVLLSLVMQAALEAAARHAPAAGPHAGDRRVKFIAPVAPGCGVRMALAEQGRGVGFEVLGRRALRRQAASCGR
jgi:3-hydroxyacyl-[acyl-carrier-protein] dehydratase